MRNRFFFIILLTLILSALAINFVHIYFFRNQRLILIDQQIATTSDALISSDIFRSALADPKTIDAKITSVIGPLRIGKVFVIRDKSAKVLYESGSMLLLPVQLPTSPEWVGVETDQHYIRIRNIELPGKSRATLQVGLVLDQNFIAWEILDTQVINYITAITLAIFLASVMVTFFLLAPLRNLITHLGHATENLSNLKDVDPLPNRLFKYASGFWARSDEFSMLVETVQRLIDRINQNYKLTRAWTLQMAHELKTPLSIIRATTDSQLRKGAIPQKHANEIVTEVNQMSSIINDFLDWAELESSALPKDLHSLKIRTSLQKVVTRLNQVAPDRIRTEIHNDFNVIANPNHLDQLITNLLTNALKFSPSDAPVQVHVSGRTLSVRDHGPGLSTEVIERMGEPFNVGTHEDNTNGTGLGLAWVITVSKLYGWQITFTRITGLTEARVEFTESRF